MNFQPIHELKHILIRLLNGDIKYVELGICGHLKMYWNDSFDDICSYHWYHNNLPYNTYCVSQLVSVLMESWPAGTGDATYPIPSSTDECDNVAKAVRTYDLCDNKWEGEQHELRINLLIYMVEELDKLIKEGYQ